MADWATMDTAPVDRIVQLYCPGACSPTRDVLQGCWNTRLGIWTLNPYGTTQFTALNPTRWAELDAPPVIP